MDPVTAGTQPVQSLLQTVLTLSWQNGPVLESFLLTNEQIALLAPYLIVFGGACLTLIASVTPFLLPRFSVPGLTLLTLAGACFSSCSLSHGAAQSLFGGMLLVDSFSCWANMLFTACGFFVILFSYNYLQKQALNYFEYYVLVLLAVLGMMLMTSSLSLIIIFIALELMSLAVYVLVGFRRTDKRSNEAAIKYYILGSAASAILLYGGALLYGSTLSLDIREIATRLIQAGGGLTPMVVLGLLCVLVGFLFKVASVPFHAWMPDVYEGAPTPITGFMTTGLKAAVVITLLRVVVCLNPLIALNEAMSNSMHHVLWVSALATMFIGNVIALQQTNLKRMLAYSSIAHSGYLLVGFLAGGVADGYTAVYFYILVYAIMNLGAFAVLTALSHEEDSGLTLDGVSALARQRPGLAFALAVFLFSMAGLPPTAGFTAKYFLLYSAVQAGEVWLVVLAVLCSAIAAYYYLRVIVHMYMRDPVGNWSSAALVPVSKGVWLTVAVTGLLVLKLGILPSETLKRVGSVVQEQIQPSPSATRDARLN